MKKPPAHVLLIEDNPGDTDLVRLRLVEANSDLDVTCADRLATGLDSLDRDEPAHWCCWISIFQTATAPKRFAMF